ncbi:MAG: hypothetical protein R3F43_19355 [bacterium]
MDGQLRRPSLWRGRVLFYDDAVPAGTITAAPPMGRRRFAYIAWPSCPRAGAAGGRRRPRQVVLDAAGAATFVDPGADRRRRAALRRSSRRILPGGLRRGRRGGRARRSTRARDGGS